MVAVLPCIPDPPQQQYAPTYYWYPSVYLLLLLLQWCHQHRRPTLSSLPLLLSSLSPPGVTARSQGVKIWWRRRKICRTGIVEWRTEPIKLPL